MVLGQTELWSAASDLVGKHLMDRYTVRERIAYGGMGVTYQGIDERLHRPVCIKVFIGLEPSRPEYRTILEHFVQEAFTLSRLRHPNTLRIYDFGHLEHAQRPTPFFVTEYAEGGTLKQWVDGDGPLEREVALEVLEPIAGALREAHDCGIVHRDIKPSNILFTYAGAGRVAKLADFSVAKAFGDLPFRADDTAAIGDRRVPLYSLSWAAPEQLADGVVGPPADVFALGLTTAFMLSGKMIYPGTNAMELYARRREGEGYRAQVIASFGLDPELERVVLDATRESVDDRTQSVEAFLDAFDLAVERLDATRSRISGPTTPEPVSSPDDTSLATGVPRFMVVDQTQPAPGERPTATLANLGRAVSLGRRLIHPRAWTSELELGTARGPVRLRLTPMNVGGARLHLKGLNCYIEPTGGRPSSGIDVWHSTELAFSRPDGQLLDRIRIVIGSQAGAVWKFELVDCDLDVPTQLAPWAIVVDPADGRDAVFLYTPA